MSEARTSRSSVQRKLRRLFGLAVLLALGIAFGRYAYTRITVRAPGPAAFDLGDAIFELTLPPPDRNVEDALEAILGSLPDPPYPTFSTLVAQRGPWTPDTRPALRDVIRYIEHPAVAGPLDALPTVAAGSIPRRADGPYYSCVEICRLLAARIRHAVHQEPVPFETLHGDVVAGLNLARMFYEHPHYHSHWAGRACEHFVINELAHLAGQARLSAAQFRRLLAAVSGVGLPENVPFEALMTYRELLFRQDLLSHFTVDKDGNGWLDLASVTRASFWARGRSNPAVALRAAVCRGLNVFSFVFYDRRTVEQFHRELFAAYRAAEGLPGSQGLAVVQEIDGRLDDAASPLYGVEDLSVPRYARFYAACLGFLTDREAARALLALEIWRQEHGGQYPDSLAQLVPDPLPAVPRDRRTDTPLTYRRLDDAFLLCAVDHDGGDRDAAAEPKDHEIGDRSEHTYPRPRADDSFRDADMLADRPDDPWAGFASDADYGVEDYSHDLIDPLQEDLE